MTNPFRTILAAMRRLRLQSASNEQWIEHLRSLGMEIGENCRILDRHVPGEPFLVRIGDHVTITSGCRLITHDGGIWIYRAIEPWINRYAPIEIKDNCFLGVNSIVLPGVTIGPNSIVAAGSVVTRDVPANSIVGGVPARVISSADEYLERARAEAIDVPQPLRERILAGEDQTLVMRDILIEHFASDTPTRSPRPDGSGSA